MELEIVFGLQDAAQGPKKFADQQNLKLTTSADSIHALQGVWRSAYKLLVLQLNFHSEKLTSSCRNIEAEVTCSGQPKTWRGSADDRYDVLISFLL